MDHLIHAVGLSRVYGSRVALRDLDLSLDAGDILGLLGANGAGKTTCLKLLSGTLAPSRGRVEVAGIDLARRPLAAKRLIGYLPERPPLYPELRVDEFLTFCARLRGLTGRRSREQVAAARQRCGLDQVGGRPIGTLSKGYRQRVGIAQAMLHRPRLLILDEPTDGLDPLQTREIRALIRELAQDCGVILSSHQLPEIQRLCDQVVILHQGKVHYRGRIQPDADSPHWLVRFSPFVDSDTLASLPSVELVKPLDGGGRYRITLGDGCTSADLAREAVAAGLDLFELKPRRGALEQVFFDLIGVAEAV